MDAMREVSEGVAALMKRVESMRAELNALDDWAKEHSDKDDQGNIKPLQPDYYLGLAKKNLISAAYQASVALTRSAEVSAPKDSGGNDDD